MINMGELDRHLSKVGLSRFGENSLDDGVNAGIWRSDYAEVFIIEAPTSPNVNLKDFIQRIDVAVAKRLRSARDAGHQREAHVCIMLDGASVSGGQLKSESDISRYVSRKYWIDKDRPVEQILTRLSLAWIDLKDQSLSNSSNVPPELQSIRDRVSSMKGAGAANAFLGRFGGL